MEAFRKLPATMVHPTVKNVEFDIIDLEHQWAVVNILLKTDFLKKPMKIFGPGIVFTWVN